MNLICDALSVLGSRHGLVLDPVNGGARVIRFDMFDEGCPVELRAGIRINGEEHLFPFCRGGRRFAFFDQRVTPCTSRFIGIEAHHALKVTLTVATPFRPRDRDFSTTPVLAISLRVEQLRGNFRWTPVREAPERVECFFEIAPQQGHLEPGPAGTLDFCFESRLLRAAHPEAGAAVNRQPQRDRLISPHVATGDNGFRRQLDLSTDGGSTLDVFWCTWSDPVLEVKGRRCPFVYNKRFADLSAVVEWCRSSGGSILDNARRVDAIVLGNNLPPSVNRLMAQTLHSWLMNTWWVDRGGADWFSVWEGSCGFHSTVDVEFTQAPFYLAVWPELLGIELDFWPEFAKSGTLTLGARGEGTEFLSHDCGDMARANGQAYPHEMEVEETANYLILLYAHWRRTGDSSIWCRHVKTIERFALFLERCGVDATGVPETGVANTIDDGSPALQYGREQVYLAVKTLLALRCAGAILESHGDAIRPAALRMRAELIRSRVEEVGWTGGHYACLMNPDGRGLKNPWTGKDLELEVVPGWDGHHIYTCNGMAPLDMVGFASPLDAGRVRADIRNAAAACLREYGCSHSDFEAEDYAAGGLRDGMVGVSARPGWISMNMVRDICALYRGIDLMDLSERYWDWQLTTNTQAPALFFETFGGNNLHFYPRGIAVWGFFDAAAGLVIDRVAGTRALAGGLDGVDVPCLLEADWLRGTAPRLVKPAKS